MEILVETSQANVTAVSQPINWVLTIKLNMQIKFSIIKKVLYVCTHLGVTE